MLVRDYERAKALARERSDQDLAGALARHDRIGFRLAIIGLASLLLLLFGSQVAVLLRAAPAAGSGHPGLCRLLTTFLPALGIVAFMVGSDILRKKRGLVELARRIRAENAAKEGASCRHG